MCPYLLWYIPFHAQMGSPLPRRSLPHLSFHVPSPSVGTVPTSCPNFSHPTYPTFCAFFFPFSLPSLACPSHSSCYTPEILLVTTCLQAVSFVNWFTEPLTSYRLRFPYNLHLCLCPFQACCRFFLYIPTLLPCYTFVYLDLPPAVFPSPSSDFYFFILSYFVLLTLSLPSTLTAVLPAYPSHYHISYHPTIPSFPDALFLPTQLICAYRLQLPSYACATSLVPSSPLCTALAWITHLTCLQPVLLFLVMTSPTFDPFFLPAYHPCPLACGFLFFPLCAQFLITRPLPCHLFCLPPCYRMGFHLGLPSWDHLPCAWPFPTPMPFLPACCRDYLSLMCWNLPLPTPLPCICLPHIPWIATLLPVPATFLCHPMPCLSLLPPSPYGSGWTGSSAFSSIQYHLYPTVLPKIAMPSAYLSPDLLHLPFPQHTPFPTPLPSFILHTSALPSWSLPTPHLFMPLPLHITYSFGFGVVPSPWFAASFPTPPACLCTTWFIANAGLPTCRIPPPLLLPACHPFHLAFGSHMPAFTFLITFLYHLSSPVLLCSSSAAFCFFLLCTPYTCLTFTFCMLFLPSLYGFCLFTCSCLLCYYLPSSRFNFLFLLLCLCCQYLRCCLMLVLCCSWTTAFVL